MILLNNPSCNGLDTTRWWSMLMPSHHDTSAQTAWKPRERLGGERLMYTLTCVPYTAHIHTDMYTLYDMSVSTADCRWFAAQAQAMSLKFDSSKFFIPTVCILLQRQSYIHNLHSWGHTCISLRPFVSANKQQQRVHSNPTSKTYQAQVQDTWCER